MNNGAKGQTTIVAPVKTMNIKSKLGPFHVIPDYKTVYPKVVIQALFNLYHEYNRAFNPLIKINREWGTDYSPCLMNGSALNWCIQIDMVGLQETDLEMLDGMPEIEIREILRKRIFEIENSLAMYQLLEKMFENGSESFFKKRFRAVLDGIRQRFGRPIALLAVTDEKYSAMLESEFGKFPGEGISDQEVQNLSGFDAFFSPQQFRDYLAVKGGQCEYLLYVRSSDPVSKQKKPDIVIEHPLLSNSDIRRIIRANSLTINVDAPEMEFERRINDTKEYMFEMGMAFPIMSLDDLRSEKFRAYLSNQGIDIEDVLSGKRAIRCKPAKCTYGCYGHVSGYLTNTDFRSDLKRNLIRRGSYVVQPEFAIPEIVIADDKFSFIDRNFFGMINGEPVFLGGFRNMLPSKSFEVKQGRIHGNRGAVWGQIVAE